MREIKFRGKRVDNGEWVYGDRTKSPMSENVYIITEFIETDTTNDINECVAYEVIPETVGQFTGLFDKQGKEIYEGDIVKCFFGEYSHTRYRHNIGYIEYFKDEWLICSTLKIPRDCESITMLNEIEVIGNIYENPELLEDR